MSSNALQIVHLGRQVQAQSFASVGDAKGKGQDKGNSQGKGNGQGQGQGQGNNKGQGSNNGKGHGKGQGSANEETGQPEAFETETAPALEVEVSLDSLITAEPEPTDDITTELVKENPFRYAGYYWDRKTQFYYLQARYYDPRSARFISEDTYEGEIENPQSLNLYVYVQNNPLIYIDPTGKWCESADGNWSHPGICFDLRNLSRQEADYLHAGDWIIENGKKVRKYYPYHFILVVGVASTDDFMDPLGEKLLSNNYGDYIHVNLFSGNFAQGVLQLYGDYRNLNFKRTKQLADIIEKEYAKLNDMKYGSYTKLVVIGHSGGGMLASQATKVLEDRGNLHMLHAVFTIGSPSTVYKSENIPIISFDGTQDAIGVGDYFIKLKGTTKDPFSGHTLYFNDDNINATYKAIIVFLNVMK